ncbi:toprim domain-containing protein [Brevibacillus ruminantium]|uniref:Toprim domain-containing protein n=1 Tax=Brevibacillus ruminantium TaxID=2950604 RepID=A0ABY4WDD2_9BACL|nr:toprim domain-containing protein [Brevibacillus ruminantium]USG64861.1 toprim domain-containing protein [Brevibacillus ruminantium]
MNQIRAIIVEGKTDREKLQHIVAEPVLFVCTYGTYSAEKAAHLAEQLEEADEIYIFTDEDDSGKKLRSQLAEDFPDAYHLHTQSMYAQVAHTPWEVLAEILQKADFQVRGKNEGIEPSRG